MYSTRTTPRILTLAKQSLEALPLAELGKDFRYTREVIIQEYNQALANEIEAAKSRYIRQWNATNEASYEGSFEELNLESNARAKLGGLPDLGSHPEIVALIEDFSGRFGVKKNAEWFFSQAVAKFGTLTLAKTDKGLYSAKKLFLDHIAGDDALYALVQLCKHPQRSVMLEKQTDVKYRNYSSLVPIVMSAFKKFANIGYEQWDRSEIFGITEPNLVKAMMLDSLPDLTIEEVLEEREIGLTVKTGATAGSLRNPATTYTLYFRAESPLAALPALARIMMCQTWCAHPSNRSEYMILNPLKWDDMPDPLVTGDIIRKATSAPVTNSDRWDY